MRRDRDQRALAIPPFRPQSETELSRLSDEQLVAYIDAAREAGEIEMAKRASGVLAWGHQRTIAARVRAKVPMADIDDVVAEVLESVVKSLFEGLSVGQFGAWLRTITQRRIADFHRDRERKPRLDQLSGEDPENDTAPEPGAEDEGFVGVEIREAAARVLETRSAEHQMVIRLYGPNEIGYTGFRAAEAAARVEAASPGSTMTAANVHQIWKRFKRDLQIELGLGGS